jgi:hypothetical protein
MAVRISGVGRLQVSLLRSIMGSPKMSIAGLGTSADRCPISRSIHSAIDIMTAYELLSAD